MIQQAKCHHHQIKNKDLKQRYAAFFVLKKIIADLKRKMFLMIAG
jgi:hypothetical protein